MNIKFKLFAFFIITILYANNIHASDSKGIIINHSAHELIAPEGESYQWYYDGELIQGAESGTLTPNASGLYEVTVTDEQNNVTTTSIAVEVVAETIIRIFIIGDSTVTNYNASQYPFTGWGQVLQYYFDDTKINTYNRAKGGRSSRSYIEEGSWDNVLTELVAGDYVFIQFGHNDRDYSNESRYTSPTDYKTYLTQYVTESRAIGAIPVLVSPMNMNSTTNVFTEYRAAMLEVANNNNVPFIDLNLKSLAFYNEVGTDYASYFIHMGLEPGEYDNYPNGYSDYWTHYQEMGALTMARMITEEIQDQQTNIELEPIASALKPLYNVSVSLNKPDAGIATVSGDFPEGATVTLKASLNGDNVLYSWVDDINGITMDGNLTTFTMQPQDYVFTGIVTDCNGTIDGTAAIDECGVCTGGETGLNACTQQIPCIDFCETNANTQLLLDDENLYNLVINTEGVPNAYVSQLFSVTATDSYLFALTYTNPTAGESLNIYVDDVLKLSDVQLATTGAWDIIEIILDIDAGEHTIKIQTNSISGGAMFNDLALYSNNISASTCTEGNTTQETAFSQLDNIIVMEAENYTDLKTGTNGTNWRKAKMDGSSSGEVVIAPAGTSYSTASTAQSTAPVLKYNVNFPYTGSYSIWARVYAFNASNDSYHLGLDGSVKIEKIDMYSNSTADIYEEFTWLHVNSKTLNVTSTGYQSLEVYLREPNLIIDKIILSLDDTYSPSDLGPDETRDQTTALFDISVSNQEFNVYPNPADTEVNISYSNLEAGQVNLSVFNTSGQKIIELINDYQQAGCQNITWNLNSYSNLNGGLYLIRLQKQNITQMKKIIINK